MKIRYQHPMPHRALGLAIRQIREIGKAANIYFGLILMLFLLLNQSQVFAQSDSANLTGMVTDPNGAVVANASVTLTSTLTRQSRETATDAQGLYRLANLAVGRYKVVVTARSFQSVSQEVTVSASADFRRVDGVNDQDVFNSPSVLNGTVVGAGTQTATGVFGEVSLRPAKQFEVLGSLRYDHFRDADGRIATNDVAQIFSTRTFNVVSPRPAMRYQFIEAPALRSAYYEGFRAPTLAERYRGFESPTFRGLSNPDLEEERLRGGDVGLDIRHGVFDGQVNYFYNRLRNFVGSAEFGFVDGKFSVINTNVAKIRSQGIEAIGNLRFTDSLTLTGNYTFTDSEATEGRFQGNPLEGAPRQVVSFGLNYYAPFGLSISPRGRFVDDAFQDITGEAPMDAHFVFDLFAGYRLQRPVELFVTAENLFNRQYIVDGFGQTLAAPRQVSGGIRFTF